MSDVGTKPFVKLLVMHMLRSKKWMENAHSAMADDVFNDTTERAEAVLWSIASKYWKAHGDVIPKTILVQELTTFLSDNPMSLEDEEQAELALLAHDAYALPESELAPDYMIDQTQLFLDERIMRPQLEAAASADISRMSEALDYSLRRIAMSRTSTGSVVPGFLPGTEGFETLMFEPTGLPMVDIPLGGGIIPKTVGGLYGASNGGKTTLAIQILTNVSKLYTGNRAAVLMGYEKTLDPEYTLKIYSNLLRVPVNKLGRSWDEWSPETKARLTQELAIRKGRMIPIDMVKGGRSVGSGGVAETAAKLRSLEDKGTEIGLVIVDQVLPQARKFMAAHGGKNDTIRDIMSRQVDEYMKLAADAGYTFLLLHQWTPDIAAKTPPWGRPKLQDTAECKGWASFMDWSFAIGNMDKNGVGLIVNTKSRTSGKGETIVRFDGSIGEFTFEEGRYELRGRKFIDLREEGDSYSAKTAEPTRGGFKPRTSGVM